MLCDGFRLPQDLDLTLSLNTSLFLATAAKSKNANDLKKAKQAAKDEECLREITDEYTVPNSGGGNCLYLSAASASGMTPREIRAMALAFRSLTCDEMTDNPLDYSSYYTGGMKSMSTKSTHGLTCHAPL